ncbi:uncharacterized protein DC041_0000585 [Schistosoma bovis]|uniref:Uncharacterized protein n=1 Tax=Schistosoma bovis TaxID=6184 RepID=A0A430Q6E1_SCHBO|nr:uncharacterized protein DC041_0000585 [Schistosoma bovis]
MSYESSPSDICPPNSDSFTWKVLKYWKDFRAACKTFCNISNDEDHLNTVTKFTEDEFSELISVILDRFMTSSKTTLVNSDGIISYYFFKALLNPHKCIESESEKDIITDEQNSSTQNALKIGCVLDTALEDSETAKAFPICICIEFISDILKDNSSTVLLLYHLSELWNKLGSIIKKLVEHIIVDQNGKANNDQEVFLFEVFRLWRSALKACTTVDDKKMDNTRDCAFTNSHLILDPNDLQLWSILSSIHELLMDIELGESNMVHSYENSIIILFSEDDAQLFRVLDLWIQIEDHIKSTE